MRRFLRPYALFMDFRGRSSRSEYWLFVFCHAFLLTLLLSLERRLTLPRFDFGMGIFSAVYLLLLVVPFAAVHVRRLHDTGAGNWLAAATLVPIVGWFMVMIQLLMAGQTQDNEYGSPPP